MADPFYITTAINYPNGRPHIGHAYEAIAADAIARFHRQAGRDVRFQTGTDEHGLKMVQTARARGVEVRALADEMSGYFREMAAKLNISYDRFIRTVEPQHHAATQALWEAMEASDDLYLDRYEGWYSVRDEAFYDEKELIDGEGGKLSPNGAPVEWTAEETWFFRLSKYQQRLLDHYAAHPEFIEPESRRNEILRFVEGGLSDLSVSRTSFDWGVKVPGSDGHVMYVWVDALTNYISGLGYPEVGGDFARYWPANLHLIGKDIVRFHTVYWPAFLMSANIELPVQTFGHGFVLNRGEKMSKSTGNIVDPVELADRFGVDPLRYFLLRDISFGNDGSFSAEAIVTRSNADLSNSFGNLAQRTLSFIAKNCDGMIPVVEGDDDLPNADAEFLGTVEMHLSQLLIEFRLLNLDRAVQEWMRAVFAGNAYIDEQAPWALRKTDPSRMEQVLSVLCLAIHHIALAIVPVIPRSANAVLDQLGVPQDQRDHPVNDNGLWHIWNASWAVDLKNAGTRLPTPSPVFPRLELPAAEPA
ncbi:methionine--tRNA ligase [Sphingomonas koreensis]|nr:methionine--tRNA ligase [Sphingomonas koreensis]